MLGGAVALLILAGGARAQVRTADPIKRGLQLTDFPRFVKLVDNVYGYEEIRQPGFTTVSLVVIGRDGVLLADGQGSVAATQTLLDRIKTLTPLPVRWYVVGSDHGDHTGGNAALPKDAQMISRASLGGDERTFDLGGTTAKVMFLGRAHTGTDLSVLLPRERILFMSEAYLNRVFPAMRSAFPSEWVRVVDRALAMDVNRFVPGHGFIEEPKASREELVAFRDALIYVNTEVRRLHDLGLSAADATAKANWGQYNDWFLREQQAPIAIRKVYEELEGKLPPVETLEQAIRARVSAVPGAEVGVAFRDLGNGDSLDVEADVRFHAASTMKVPVMIQLFRDADAGRIRLDGFVPVENRFASIVDGSPYALNAGDDSDSSAYKWVGQTATVHDLLDHMITRSSNLATNLLIALVEAKRADATAHALGARDIEVRRGVEDGKAFAAGLNNTTTARDLAALMTAIETNKAASRASCDSMRAVLLRQEFNGEIPAGLPPGTRVAHKTGSITGHLHDAAIVYPAGGAPYVLVVLTRGIANEATARLLIADISRLVWAYTRH